MSSKQLCESVLCYYNKTPKVGYSWKERFCKHGMYFWRMKVQDHVTQSVMSMLGTMAYDIIITVSIKGEHTDRQEAIMGQSPIRID